MKLRLLRRPPARSLYFRLLQLGLVLVLLPSLLIGIAWIYEHFAIARADASTWRGSR